MSRFVRFPLVLVTLAGLAVGGALVLRARAQSPAPALPSVLSFVSTDAEGTLVFKPPSGGTFAHRDRPAAFTVAQLQGSPVGTATGLALDFKKPGFNGTLVFGLVPFHDTKYPQPVWRTSVAITDGKAAIDIKSAFGDRYDMVGWQTSGTAVIGYRLISSTGGMVYDGRIRFTGTGPFQPAVTMLEGPFVANIGTRGAVVWFTLNQPAPCSVTVNARTIPCAEGAAHQEILVEGLAPSTDYSYTVRYDGFEETYGFRTAPIRGSARPFTFSYSSDSRGGQGGGDRNFNGPNAYIMRKSVALARQRQSAFMLFTGDLVSGSVTDQQHLRLELANWKRAIEPHGHWMPVYTGIGNHEAVVREFTGTDSTGAARTIRMDRFPYDTESMEAVFRSELVNPENGPESEDGSAWDPDPSKIDFPSYRETAYWFIHGNAAMVVLNSNYWYSPTMGSAPEQEGNPHAYLMDNQMAWLKTTLAALDKDSAIAHVFLTVHTPVFPNGGHVSDDMWYRGKNDMRPRIAGTLVAKGIIERRDDLLMLIQKSPKVVAVLTGDEHNYNRLRLDATVPIYPDGWTLPKVRLTRPFFQVNNGAAGAPYYAQDVTPWSAFVKGFSTQHALCLFHVEGPSVRMEVVNPETLEVIDRAVLR
jgi:hypothetical protein